MSDDRKIVAARLVKDLFGVKAGVSFWHRSDGLWDTGSTGHQLPDSDLRVLADAGLVALEYEPEPVCEWCGGRGHDESMACGHRGKCGLYCSRPKGHDGDHVACSSRVLYGATAFGHCLSRWPQEPAPAPTERRCEIVERNGFLYLDDDRWYSASAMGSRSAFRGYSFAGVPHRVVILWGWVKDGRVYQWQIPGATLAHASAVWLAEEVRK